MTQQRIELKNLELIFNLMSELAQGTKYNAYEIYIQEIQKKRETNPNPESYMEKHHILPKFEGGSNSSENLIKLTVEEHITAHWLRWKVLGKPQDQRAYLFRIGETEEAERLRRESIRKARELDKELKQGFFSSDFQRLMGKRGGTAGGSANTEAQFLARQKVGKEYGRQTGIGNQNPQLTEFVSNYSIWAYSKNKAILKTKTKDRNDEIFFIVSPKQTFQEIANYLNSLVPNSIHKVCSMHKVVYGERPQMYGWRIVQRITRSEVEKGIQTFYINNPNSFLHYDQQLLEICEFE